MPDPLDPARLRALLDAGTPGPWSLHDPNGDGFSVDGEPDDGYDVETLDKREWGSANNGIDGATRAVGIPWDYEGYSSGLYMRRPDADLIVELVNAAPDLLNRLAKLEEAVEIVKPWVRHAPDGRAYLNSPFISRRLDDLLAALEEDR